MTSCQNVRPLAFGDSPRNPFQVSAKLVSHGRCVAVLMAEITIPRILFADILRFIAELRPQSPPVPAYDARPSEPNVNQFGMIVTVTCQGTASAFGETV